MIKLEYTQQEAITEIDKILNENFVQAVAKTLIYIINEINMGAVKKQKRVKGEIVVGYTPFDWMKPDIDFDFDRSQIIGFWQSVKGKKNDKFENLAKYTNKFDIFCWNYDNFQTFGFKFFGSFFGRKTNTAKSFIYEVQSRLTKYNCKVTFSNEKIVSLMKIKYDCKIAKDYVPSTKNLPPILTDEEAQNILFGHYGKMYPNEYTSEVINNGQGICSLIFNSEELKREVLLSTMVSPRGNLLTTALTIGRYSYKDVVQTILNIYNDTAPDGYAKTGFMGILTDATEEFKGQVMFVKTYYYTGAEDLQDKVGEYIKEAVYLLKNEWLDKFNLDPI